MDGCIRSIGSKRELEAVPSIRWVALQDWIAATLWRGYDDPTNWSSICERVHGRLRHPTAPNWGRGFINWRGCDNTTLDVVRVALRSGTAADGLTNAFWGNIAQNRGKATIEAVIIFFGQEVVHNDTAAAVVMVVELL